MADRYFDEKIETLPPELLRKVQDHRLRWQFRRCWDGSAWYRARFEAAGLSPETFGGVADVSRLPLLTLTDLRSVILEAWRVAPAEWIVGTDHEDGFPVRSRTHGDTVHARDRAARAARSQETAGPSATHTLDVAFAVQVAAFSCEARNGLHWGDDHLLAEIIDGDTLQPVADGETGELVVTDLVREASPLIRFRTGLEAMFTNEPCACGRTSSRIRPVQPLA